MLFKNPKKHRIITQTKHHLCHQRPSYQRYRFSCLFIALAVIASACSLSLLNSSNYANAASCADVQFIFARGSGEELNGPSMSAWRNEIVAALNNSQTDLSGLSYNFYELGSRTQGGHQYPAVAVAGSFDGYVNLLGAFFSGGNALRFGASVDEGVAELRSYISSTSIRCPKTKFVLGGYSQGAMLISGTLSSLESEKIIYVSTFGDPKLYLPEGNHNLIASIPKVPDACRGQNLSAYRSHVPDCWAYEGVLGSYRPYQPENYAGKLGTWCNEKDIMCSSGTSLSDHTSYVSSNLYRDAAQVIAGKIIHAFPDQASIDRVLQKALHNIAFVIDSTGSMSGTIRQYQKEAEKLATKVKAEGGQIALLEYRDLAENFNTRMLCSLACDLSEFSSQLYDIRTQGGGDNPESALSALLYAMNNLKWQAGATKSIVLITDDAYHVPDFDGTTLGEVVKRSLEIDPVNVFVVVPNRRGLADHYQELTARTNGKVFVLGVDDLSSITDSIFDRPIAKLGLSTYTGQVGDEFIFDASASYAANGGELRFDWDLNGDGEFERQNTAAKIKHTYSAISEHFAQVRVTDAAGYSSTMSAQVIVTDGSPSNLPSISDLKVTKNTDENAEEGITTVEFRTDGAKVLLSIDRSIQGFIEVKSGAAQFNLQDVPDDMNIVLTPYSENNERGYSATFTIANPVPIAPEEPASDESQNPANQPTLTGIQKPSGVTQPTSVASGNLAVVPKAPNTGYRSRSCELKCQ